MQFVYWIPCKSSITKNWEYVINLKMMAHWTSGRINETKDLPSIYCCYFGLLIRKVLWEICCVVENINKIVDCTVYNVSTVYVKKINEFGYPCKELLLWFFCKRVMSKRYIWKLEFNQLSLWNSEWHFPLCILVILRGWAGMWWGALWCCF